MDPGLIELFVDGKEDGLPDSGRLDGLGWGGGSVVFLLQRAGWHWTACGSGMALSEERAGGHQDGYVQYHWRLVTGEPMTEGRDYWEVELTKMKGSCMLGTVQPGLDHDKMHWDTNGASLHQRQRGRSLRERQVRC
jgi:hypothetical protein